MCPSLNLSQVFQGSIQLLLWEKAGVHWIETPIIPPPIWSLRFTGLRVNRDIWLSCHNPLFFTRRAVWSSNWLRSWWWSTLQTEKRSNLIKNNPTDPRFKAVPTLPLSISLSDTLISVWSLSSWTDDQLCFIKQTYNMCSVISISPVKADKCQIIKMTKALLVLVNHYCEGDSGVHCSSVYLSDL